MIDTTEGFCLVQRQECLCLKNGLEGSIVLLTKMIAKRQGSTAILVRGNELIQDFRRRVFLLEIEQHFIYTMKL